MNFALLLIAVAVLTSVTVGSVLMILGVRNAPEGYEDENGFHHGEQIEALIPVSSNSFAECLEEEMAYASR